MLLPHHSWECLRADVKEMSQSLVNAGNKERGQGQAFLSFSRAFTQKVFHQKFVERRNKGLASVTSLLHPSEKWELPLLTIATEMA